MSESAAAPRPPELAAVRAWIGVPASVVPDGQLETVLAAERGAQAELCRIEPWTDQLTQALYRRVGRQVAAMGLPLGVVSPDSEYGGANLPRYDVEIERLERPRRLVVVG